MVIMNHSRLKYRIENLQNRNLEDVMKKLLAVVLVAAMSLSLAACGGKSEAPAPSGEAPAPVAGKVAIMTGTASQGEEELRAGEEAKAKWGDRIVTATYPDNFTKETETVISNVVGLVSDPDVKALVFCQAIPGASAAIEKAREIKPDLLVIAGVPAENPGVISAAADVVLSADEIEGMGFGVPNQAQIMGAKTYVHYSFPRHMSYPTLSARRDLMKKTCEELGMEFVEATAPDPTGDAGVPGAQQFIMEDVPKMVEKYGKDTAFFSTNCAMQEPLIKQVIATGAIYPQPCCPSPFHGFPNALGIQVPADKAGDTAFMIEAVTKVVADKGMTGRLSTWPIQANRTEVMAGADYAIRWMDGEFAEKFNMDQVKTSFENVTGGSKVSVNTLNEGGNNYPNYVVFMSEYITF